MMQILTESIIGIVLEEVTTEWSIFREHLHHVCNDYTFHQTLEEVASKLTHLPNLQKLATIALTLPVSTAGRTILVLLN